jgi:hypothetical protein
MEYFQECTSDTKYCNILGSIKAQDCTYMLLRNARSIDNRKAHHFFYKSLPSKDDRIDNARRHPYRISYL